MVEITESDSADQQLVIKNGFFVKVVDFGKIKLITAVLGLFLILDVFFSLKLFVSAIQIRSYLGYFINMITNGDGDILPSLQAIPVLFFLIINVFMIFFIYAIFDTTVKPALNRFMFMTIFFGFILLIVLFAIIIAVIAHAYSAHEELHDGIVTAMRRYRNSSVYKYQIDHLQIEFQCCGSKKYDEWYTVKWADPALETGTGSAEDGNTPFSCCSMKALAPCIHHNIEVTGKAYLYTPEYNLSISTRGCYEMIREKKQQVGWVIVGNLTLFFFFQTVTIALCRFLQTAHFLKHRFFGNSRMYTIWLFGSYSGKVKEDSKEPPPLPPIPPELKDM